MSHTNGIGGLSNNWIDPTIEPPPTIDTSSPSAIMAEVFDLYERSAQFNRENSNLNTSSSLHAAESSYSDETEKVAHAYTSGELGSVGEFAGAAATGGLGVAASKGLSIGARTVVPAISTDTAFQLSASIGGAVNAAGAWGASAETKEAGLADAASQLSDKWGGQYGKWSDDSASLANAFAQKMQSFNEDLCNCVGQANIGISDHL